MCCRDALKERLSVEEGHRLKIMGEKCTNAQIRGETTWGDAQLGFPLSCKDTIVGQQN
jgi:hypothetical protein